MIIRHYRPPTRIIDVTSSDRVPIEKPDTPTVILSRCGHCNIPLDDPRIEKWHASYAPISTRVIGGDDVYSTCADPSDSIVIAPGSVERS